MCYPLESLWTDQASKTNQEHHSDIYFFADMCSSCGTSQILFNLFRWVDESSKRTDKASGSDDQSYTEAHPSEYDRRPDTRPSIIIAGAVKTGARYYFGRPADHMFMPVRFPKKKLASQVKNHQLDTACLVAIRFWGINV